MIDDQNDEILMKEFELDSILPQYIINSEGEKEPFELERIRKSLIIDVGLEDSVSSEIIDAVVRKIVGLLSLQYKSISTHTVKDFISEELSSRGLDKYKDIYERIEKKKRTKFVLSEEFIDQFRGKQPEWGPLGYIAYKRTYARTIEDENRIEEFFETIRRVVEGCFSLQKEHCIKLGLPWIEPKARISAEKMYKKMWNFKFSPPGRGLWLMGTPFIDKHGSMGLNNCGFCSTEDLDIKGPMAFQWNMDAQMLGVGVGFDTKGAGKVILQEPDPAESVYVIPDSREGWVKALGKVLDGFFSGKDIPTFDYSQIRPAGAPIKGFGGFASGPGPLKEMLEDIHEMLLKKVGRKITSTDIVDIFNLIGKCVVAGNVRRSAEIALGSIKDFDFITMKQDEALLKHHRWASNNSVIASVGMKYDSIIESIATNGEPGVFWLDNAQKYSRINGDPDYKDKKAMGVNPCISGDTLIAVADGRDAVAIKQLAEEGADVPVYCKDEKGITHIRMMRNPRITGYNKKIFEVVLDDGSTIRCTGNHKFYLRNNKKREAHQLKSGDSLVISSKWQTSWSEIMKEEKRKKSLYWLLNDGKINIFEHRFIFEELNNTKLEKGEVIHHKDDNELNNAIHNLESMKKDDHDALHDISVMREYKRYISRKKKTELDVIFNKCTYVKKICENCEQVFIVKWDQREQAFCSHKCSNEISVIKARKVVRQKAEKKHTDFKSQIIELFEEYVQNNFKIPTKSEFDLILKKNGIYDLRTAGLPDNYQNFLSIITHKYDCEEIYSRKLRDDLYNIQAVSILEENGLCYNHKIVSVKEIGIETVYNGTVDEFHNFGVILTPKTTKSGNLKYEMIFTANCGEQTLESYELCCLVETFPSRHETYEEYEDTLKYAYLYAKSVTLENTHWAFTNAVMGKNRRIGTSQSGIIDAFVRHGRKNILDWCEKGYNFLKKLDEIYSDWLCIPKSIKITSVKPSGTVSLLPGVSPGIHYPHSKYYIRRMRLSTNSDLIPVLKEAGYHIELDVYSKNALVVEFPIEEKFFERSKNDVSMWEQFENAAAYQRYWSDNQVSVTVTFKKEEVKDIKYALECYESKLKSVSMLPILDHGYEQAPYEEITKERYEEMKAKIKPLNLKNITTRAIGEEGCSTDACELKKEISLIKEAITNGNGSDSLVKIEKDARFTNFCIDLESDEEKDTKN